MGKMKPRVLGDLNVEADQKEKAKKRSTEKKQLKDLKEIVEPSESESTSVEKKPAKTKEVKVAKKKISKKHAGAKSKVDTNKSYTLVDAVELLKKINYVKFDSSIELHVNLTQDGVKGEVEMPFSTGKLVRVAVVNDDVLAKIESGVVDFDILIAHPSYMTKLAKFAKLLGPRGLMPNPKNGTVSATPEEVAKKFEKGTLRFKSESKFPLLHIAIAKISLPTEHIAANAEALLGAVGKNNISAVFIKSSMSPSLRVVTA